LIKGGGYIGYFGLEEWYYSLCEEDQEKIVKYFVNFTQTRELLLEDGIHSTNNTAVKMLSYMAHAAASSKDHSFSDMLMKKAGELVVTKEDREHYGYLKEIIFETKKHTPDQYDIDRYKNRVLELIGAQPGILQRDVKKLFRTEDETVVGHALSQLKYEGKIERIKKGNSFELYVFSKA